MKPLILLGAFLVGAGAAGAGVAFLLARTPVTVETPAGPAFRIDNPGAPPRFREIGVRELRARLDAGERPELYDVRTPEERAKACLDDSRLLDPESAALLENLDRDTLLVFYSHYGRRSRAAAAHFAALGFRNAVSVAGGIDAWSREIDPSVPRY